MAISDYKNNIPQANDRLSLSQNDLLQNFAALEDWIGVDHAGSQSADAGKHNQSTYPRQGVAPSFGANEIGVYNILNATTSTSELYVRKAAGAQIPFTASILSASPAPVNGTAGWTYLPSGLLIKWGNENAFNGLKNITVNGIAGQPDFAAVLNIQLTVSSGAVTDTNSAVRLVTGWSIPGNSYFQVFGSARVTTGAGNAGCSWLCIGY